VITTGVDGNEAVTVAIFAPIVAASSVETVLRTRLFAATEEERWEPQHRTMAEYLAARFLADRISNCGLPLSRVVALLQGLSKKPHPSLRGLFAWLVTLLPDSAEQLVGIDPYGVVSYGDPTRLSIGVLRALLTALGRLAEREPWFRVPGWGEAQLGALATAELVPDLRCVLTERPVRPHLLSCVCDALTQGASLPELRDDLEVILADDSVPPDVRSLAVPAYLQITAGTPDAASLFQRMLTEPAIDTTLQLTSRLLMALYPSRLGVADSRVTKARILLAVREARGEQAAQRIAHLKKGEMAAAAQELLAGSRWLPEPLRTPGHVRPIPAEVPEVVPDVVAEPGSDPTPDDDGKAESTAETSGEAPVGPAALEPDAIAAE